MNISLSRIMVFGAAGCLLYALLGHSGSRHEGSLPARQAGSPSQQAKMQEFVDSKNLGWYGGDHNIVSFDADPEPSGTASCNVRIRPGRRPEGQIVSIKSISGTRSFEIEIFKESWKISAGSMIPVAIEFGDGASISAQARGFSREASFRIPVDMVPYFSGHLSDSKRMTISFAAGDEPSWGISLEGVGRALAEQRQCALSRIMKNSSSQPL